MKLSGIHILGIAVAAIIVTYMAALMVYAYANKGKLYEGRDPETIRTVAAYKRNARLGVALDRCVHAGAVLRSLQRAGDSDGYAKWQKIQEADCAEARGE